MNLYILSMFLFRRMRIVSEVALPTWLCCSIPVLRITQRIHLLAVAAIYFVALFSPSISKAESLSYTLTGGLISGTLGETPFTNANWSITATANSSSAQFLQLSNEIWAPVWYQSVTPAISISSASSVLTATLSGDGQWFLESRDYSAFSTNERGIGFFFSKAGVENGNGAYGQFFEFVLNDLQTTGTINGVSGFDTGAAGDIGFSTSVGQLFITSNTQAAGTFATSASAFTTSAPEPGQVAASLLLLSGIGIYLWRKKHAAQASRLRS